MSLIRINRTPSSKDLRVFAFLWLVFIGGFGYAAYEKGHATTAIVALGFAAGIGGLGLLAPRAVKFVYIGAVYVTFPIGCALSYLILAVIYFLVLTPIGLIMRLLGRDPLQRRFEPQRTTYWISRSQERPPASYLKQH